MDSRREPPDGDWDPEQYARFRAERAQPFHDLLALVERRPGMRVVDLGCGPGELTVELKRALEAGETVGVDNSPAMLERAAACAAPGLAFEPGDIGAWRPEAAYDLVFSNAALHWIPDHPALLARLARALRPGGQLAVQVPCAHDQPSHTAAEAVAAESPFREALAGTAHPQHVLRPERYAALLHALGFARQHVRLQVYGHVLASREQVVEWFKGSLLVDYRARLGAELYPRFERRYRERLFERLPDERPFFLPFPRLLFWARL